MGQIESVRWLMYAKGPRPKNRGNVFMVLVMVSQSTFERIFFLHYRSANKFRVVTRKEMVEVVPPVYFHGYDEPVTQLVPLGKIVTQSLAYVAPLIFQEAVTLAPAAYVELSAVTEFTDTGVVTFTTVPQVVVPPGPVKVPV